MKILLQVALVFGIYWVSQGIEAVRPIRDEIRGRIEALIADLLPAG